MVQVIRSPDDEATSSEVGTATSTALPNLSDDLKTTASVTNLAYHNITRSMMANPLEQTEPRIALKLLETALINRNVPLAKHYIENVKGLIRKDNALEALHIISRWVHMTEADHQLNFEPSAPPLVDNAEERNDDWMKQPLQELRENILLEIDKNGDYFLKQKYIQDLHYQDLLDITTRDTLQVSSELVVYGAIMRWAVDECGRKGLANEDVHTKAVLMDLIYAPRYGIMSKKEFRSRLVEGYKGPDRIGLPTEINEKINQIICLRHKKKQIVDVLPYKMSKERKKVGKACNEMNDKYLINCLACVTAVFD